MIGLADEDWDVVGGALDVDLTEAYPTDPAAYVT